MASMIVCSGVISSLPDGSTSCSTGWELQVASLPFELSQIDPSVATAMFGAGFGLFITPWATAWGFSQLLKLLR
ncbi:MAG: hypothetical protein RPS47_10825 [Colwellia sp.]